MSVRVHSEADLAAYRANIWKFYLFRWLVNFQLWLPIWVVYLTAERGLSLTEVTVLDTAFWILLVCMEVPTGAIADRYGRKLSLSYGALANAVAILVFGVAGDYVVILISYLAWGVAWTLFSGADSAFFYDSLRALGRQGDYQKLMGRSFAIQQTGVLGGILLGAPLAAWTNLPTPILLSAGLLFAAFAVTVTFKEPPRFTEGEERLSYMQGVRLAARVVLRTPPVRYMMLVAAVITALAMCVGILTQPYLESQGVDIGNFGWYLVPGNLVSIAAALSVYRVSARLGLLRLVIILPLVTMTTSVVLGAVDSLWAFVIYPLNGVVMASAMPVVTDFLNRRIPSGQRATILSMYQLLFSLIIAPLEPALGAIADAQGLQAAYRFAALFAAIAAAPLLALLVRAVRQEAAAGAAPAATAPEPAAAGH